MTTLDVPIGTEIAINRFPHDTTKPSHRVVGHREDGYLKIRPLGIPDHVTRASELVDATKLRAARRGGPRDIMVETYIPADEVVMFPQS